jgi:hypothetical protein
MLRWCIPALFLTAMGCRISGPAQKDKDFAADKNAYLLISLQQLPAPGKNPVFDARFFSDRRLVYSGVKRMPLLGNYSFYLPEHLVKNLLFEAIKLNLKNVPDSIPIPEGEQKIRLFLVQNGVARTLVGPARTGDPAFREFVRLLYQEVASMVSEQEGKKEPDSPLLKP